MDAETVERVESWNSRPLSAGLADLHRLADREFTGVAVADDVWTFMLNGRVVGVFGGTLDDVGDAEGTIYEAPDPGVPLLLAMREQGGQTDAQYYTNDTPLSEVDDTLSSGSFTGYVELSENVLSGNYYQVYYGGRSMSVAYVGESEELLTGDEAFERACDEVGIYEVVKVPIEVQDLPEPPTDAAAAAVTDTDEPEESGTEDTTVAAGDEDGGVEAAAADEDEDATPVADDAAEPSGEDTPDPTADDVDDEAAVESSAEPAVRAEDTAGEADDEDDPVDPATEPEPRGPAEPDPDPTGDEPAEPTAAAGTAPEVSPGEQSAPPTETEAGGPATESTPPAEEPEAHEPTEETEAETAVDIGPEPSVDTDEEAAAGSEADIFSEEREWRREQSIPALSPEKSGASSGAAAVPREEEDRTETEDAEPTEERPTTATSSSEVEADSQVRQRVERLQAELDDREAELADARERADRLAEAREELAAERDRLAERVEALKEDLAEARAAATTGEGVSETATEGPSLTRKEALSGTNLFVRYDSKGRPTLEDAVDGADETEVNTNLRLDRHTQFDTEGATVEGVPYDHFLDDTAEYAFVEWLVRELPYEIRDAGHREGLAGVYEALPQVDRAQLHDAVTVDVDDDEQVEERFDVVLRDRMGTPLLAANINRDRDPVSGDMMETLVDAASDVAEATEEFAGAFHVTASFFRPEALEVAEESTGGGLLSRSSKESFVHVGRKQGYHLLLVEQRDGSFYLNVPEL